MLSRVRPCGKLGSWNAVCGVLRALEASLSWNLKDGRRRCAGLVFHWPQHGLLIRQAIDNEHGVGSALVATDTARIAQRQRTILRWWAESPPEARGDEAGKALALGKGLRVDGARQRLRPGGGEINMRLTRRRLHTTAMGIARRLPLMAGDVPGSANHPT